jgi:hypothetical protein
MAAEAQYPSAPRQPQTAPLQTLFDRLREPQTWPVEIIVEKDGLLRAAQALSSDQ